MNYFELAQEKQRALIEAGRATVLSVESSCDETAAAVVRNGREVLSNVVHTQIPLHRLESIRSLIVYLSRHYMCQVLLYKIYFFQHRRY